MRPADGDIRICARAPMGPAGKKNGDMERFLEAAVSRNRVEGFMQKFFMAIY